MQSNTMITDQQILDRAIKAFRKRRADKDEPDHTSTISWAMQDFATVSLNCQGRCQGIDVYNPDTDTLTNEVLTASKRR